MKGEDKIPHLSHYHYDHKKFKFENKFEVICGSMY